MPHSKRDFLKRSLAQAHNHLEEAMLDLAELNNKFSEHHLDYAEYLQTMVQALILVQTEMEKFAVLAWNMDVTKLQSFRN